MPLYKLVINKRFVFDVSDPFSSTYELNSGETPLESTVAKTLILQVSLAEATVLWAGVQFVSGVISTWEPDSKPYDPDALFTRALSGTGLRAGNQNDLYDQDEVYKLTREPASGRAGVIQLRGALFKSDVLTISGDSTLDPNSPLYTNGTAHDDYIANLLAAFAAAGVAHVMIGEPLVTTIYPATPAGQKQVPEKVYGPPIARPVVSISTPRVGPLQRKKD